MSRATAAVRTATCAASACTWLVAVANSARTPASSARVPARSARRGAFADQLAALLGQLGQAGAQVVALAGGVGQPDDLGVAVGGDRRHRGPGVVALAEDRRVLLAYPLKLFGQPIPGGLGLLAQGDLGGGRSARLVAVPRRGGEPVAQGRGLGAGGLGLLPFLVAFGVGRCRLRRGLRPHGGDLPFHPGRAELGVQRVGQRRGGQLQPLDQLPGAGHLAAQAGGVALAHPAVAGGPAAGPVVVAAVPEGPAGAVALRYRPSTVDAGADLGGGGAHGGQA